MNLRRLTLQSLFTAMSIGAMAQTPTRLSDISSGTGSANPQNFFVYGDSIMFLAKSATNRQEWDLLNTETNTVSERTTDHSQLSSGVIFRAPVRIGNNVFVSSSKNNNTSSNLYFSRFDLTTAAEVQWNPNNATSTSDPLAFVIDSATSDVYCTFSTAAGNQIYKWNHTNGNVTQFSSIGSGGVGSTGNTSNGALMIIGNYIYTTSYGGTGNNFNYPIRISLTDGSTFTEILDGSNHLFEATRFTNINGKLYFIARTGVGSGPLNLYCYNPANTTLTALTNYTQTLASGNVNISAIGPNNKMVVPVSYYNTSPVQGEMLLIDPATNAVTHVNASIMTGNTYAYAFFNGGFVHFTQLSGTNRILLKYDLTAGTTTTVIPATAGFTTLTNFAVATDGKVYFSGATPTTGAELWSYNLTNNDVALVADISSGTTASTPANFTQIGSKLYFAATDATFGREMYSIPISNPLSIKLTNFTARNIGNTNVINWKNATEDAGETMQLQVSVDGKIFHTIANTQTSGKTNAEYEYKDEYPVAGLNYYRLMTSSRDGNTNYSNVASAFVKGATQISFYPNPAGNNIHINCSLAGKIVIIGTKGNVELKANVNSGMNNIDVSKLAAGVYFLEYNNDKEKFSQRFVKQ